MIQEVYGSLFVGAFVTCCILVLQGGVLFKLYHLYQNSESVIGYLELMFRASLIKQKYFALRLRNNYIFVYVLYHVLVFLSF